MTRRPGYSIWMRSHFTSRLPNKYRFEAYRCETILRYAIKLCLNHFRPIRMFPALQPEMFQCLICDVIIESYKRVPVLRWHGLRGGNIVKSCFTIQLERGILSQGKCLLQLCISLMVIILTSYSLRSGLK